MAKEIRGNAHALARVEMAKEKARILRKKSPHPSIYEQAALELTRREEEKRRLEQERFRVHRDGEMPLISFQQLPLKPRPRPEAEDSVEWKQYRPGQKERTKPVKMNAAMIGAIARKLKAVEWARAMGTSPRRNNKRTLEQEAEMASARWRARREGASSGKKR